MNSADANVSAVVQAADVLEIGFQRVRRIEQEIFVADQEDANEEKQQTQNDENAYSKRCGHRLHLRAAQELRDECVAALLQILERSLDHNLAVTHQSQTIGNGLCPVNIVSDDN
jgi:hypothetical protein